MQDLFAAMLVNFRPGLPDSAEQYIPNSTQIYTKTKKYIPNKSEIANQKLNKTQT